MARQGCEQNRARRFEKNVVSRVHVGFSHHCRQPIATRRNSVTRLGSGLGSLMAGNLPDPARDRYRYLRLHSITGIMPKLMGSNLPTYRESSPEGARIWHGAGARPWSHAFNFRGSNMTRTDIIVKIAERAVRLYAEQGMKIKKLDCMMDIETVDDSIGLKLDELLDADLSNFAHDIGGISRHLNRITGELEDCFVPRYAR